MLISNNYATHESFKNKNSTHEIDHALINQNSKSIVENYQAYDDVIATINNSAITTSLRSKNPKKKKNLESRINLHNFIKDECKILFNSKLMKDYADLRYDYFFKNARSS